MNEIKQDQLLKDLNDLKKIVEFPQHYLTNYFAELKNEVTREINKKKTKLENDHEETEKKLDEIRQKISGKLNLLEKQFINNKITDDEKNQILTRLNSIIGSVLSCDFANRILNQIKHEIETIEGSILKKLFQNKTIIFEDVTNICETEYRQLLDKKLLILNDTFLTVFLKSESNFER